MEQCIFNKRPQILPLKVGLLQLTRSFFFLSGVRKPFFAFFFEPASSRRFRTSAFFFSLSSAFRLAS